MNKLAFLILCLASLYSASGYSYVTRDGVRYAACNNCTTDNDFRQFAQMHYEEFNGPPVMIAVNTLNFLDLYEDISAGEIRQIRRNVNVQVDRSNPYEPVHTVTVTYDIEPVNSANMQKYNAYIDELESQVGIHNTRLSRNIGNVNLGVNNNFIWLNNTDFATQYQSNLNQMAQQASYNPFYYLDKPLLVRVSTADNYVVTLARKIRTNDEWHVLYTTRQQDGALVNYNGQVESYTSDYDRNFICTPSNSNVFCRDMNTNETFTNEYFETKPSLESKYFYEIPPNGAPRPCRPGNCTKEPDQ